MRRWRAQLLVLVSMAAAGCSQKPAASNLSIMEGEQELDLQLSRDEELEVIAAMKSVAADHEVGVGGEPAVQGMRWSDLEAAVAVACDAEGVELVVIDVQKSEDRKLFVLRTADDRPAKLDVRRTNDDRLYEASATIGRFDRKTDRERAELFIKEIDRAMRLYAKKRRLPEHDASRRSPRITPRVITRS